MELSQQELDDLLYRTLQANRIIWGLVKQLGGTARLFESTIDPFWELSLEDHNVDGKRCLLITAGTKPPLPDVLPSQESTIRPL